MKFGADIEWGKITFKIISLQSYAQLYYSVFQVGCPYSLEVGVACCVFRKASWFTCPLMCKPQGPHSKHAIVMVCIKYTTRHSYFQWVWTTNLKYTVP
jgi:hypothetical protein